MFRTSWTCVSIVAVLGVAGRVDALTVARAKIAKGVVQVRGKQAAPEATITWEGEAVTQAATNGKFRFDTTVLPEDCVGEVGDGIETVEAVVQLCGPVGPEGPQGAQGPPGADGADAPNDALRLLAVVGNASQTIETTSTTFQDIADTSVAFQTSVTTCVLAQFNALTRGDFGNAWIRAVLDGQQMEPNPVRFAGSTPGPGAFTFFRCGVPAGEHSLIIQFSSANEGTMAVVSERSLVVMSAGESGICPCPSTTTTTSTTVLPTTSTTIASPRFIDNEDGTITDNATGLMWEIKDNQGGLRDVDNQYPWAGVCSVTADRCQAERVAVTMCPIGYVGCSLCPPGGGTCEVVDGQGGSDTIFRWVARLNEAAFAGHTDWRIPRISEVNSILSEPFPCDFASPCVDPPFHNGVDSFTAGEMYWSETTHPSNPGSAWYVRFSDAYNGWTGKTDSHFVRVVRDAR